MLIKGADVLVFGASKIAKKLHISEIVIGLTVVALGTTMPELFVSIKSILSGSTDISLGNVMGSNIFNLLVIIGFTAIVNPIPFERQTKLFDIPVTLGYMIIFTLICNIGGNEIGLVKGIILFAGVGTFIIYTVQMQKKFNKNGVGVGVPDDPANKGEESIVGQTDSCPIETTGDPSDGNESNVGVDASVRPNINNSMLKNIVYIIIGIVLLKLGGDFVVENAIKIAKDLNISEKIIGLTIVAFGTSLPELVTSVVACIKKESGIAIGNVLGSNILNFFFVIGLAGIIKPIAFSNSYNFELGIIIASTLLFALFARFNIKNKINRGHGVVFVFIYVAYVVMIWQ
jgi:cation:H+ antiporter